MKEIFVDGKSVDLPDVGQETVADVVGLVASDLETSKRVIRVSMNGEDITGNTEKHNLALSDDTVLEVTTGEALKLALESLESIESFHGDLDREFSRAADEYRMSSFEHASDILASCLDGLKILLSTTMSVANLVQKSPQEIKIPNGDMEQLTRRISEVLNEMIEAQTTRDGILLADLVEYELNPLLEDWRLGVQELKKESMAA